MSADTKTTPVAEGSDLLKKRLEKIMDDYKRASSVVALNEKGKEEGWQAQSLGITNADDRAYRGAEPEYTLDERKGDLILIPSGGKVDESFLLPTPDTEKWTVSRIQNNGWDHWFHIKGGQAYKGVSKPALVETRNGKMVLKEKGELFMTFK